MEEKIQSSQVKEEGVKEVIHKKKISKGKFIALIIVLLVIWLGAIQIMAAERYNAVVNVIEGENKMVINPTNELLDFGDLSRDTGSSRFVTLKNPGKKDKRIVVIKYGSISEIMKIDRSNFVLKPGEEVKLEFHVQVPVSAPYKKYSGKIVIFKYPKLF